MSKTKKEWNPEFKYETVTGKFKDYRGNERDFTMVAVSIPMDEYDYVRVEKTVPYEKECQLPDKVVENENGEVIDFVPGSLTFFQDKIDVVLSPITKMLTIGVSVRCVRDKDNGYGERIAYGKAVKLHKHVLFTPNSGMINTMMVKALLEQEAEHFKKDPGSYLTGYNADKFRYEKTGKIADAEMTQDEVDVRDGKAILIEPSNSKSFTKSNDYNKVKERLAKEISENG